MAERSGIEWCDATFNPWIGCEKVSPGCAHCYAETLVHGRMGRGGTWGSEGTRQVTSPSNWKKPLRWARLAREGKLPDGSPNVLGHRPRVFCASLADVFEDREELVEPRGQLFDLIRLTPELDWLVLTKRPEVARDELAMLYDPLHYDILEPSDALGYLPNVWMGVSIENARHTWRADVLREIPAAVRFISAEPLLGSLYDRSRDVQADRHSPLASNDPRARDQHPDPAVGARDLPANADGPSQARPASSLDPHVGQRAPLDLTGIDWVIVGGESGSGARPVRLEWAREILDAAIDQCGACRLEGRDGIARRHPEVAAALNSVVCDRHTAVFVKQLGARPMADIGVRDGCDTEVPGTLQLRDRKGGDWDEWPADLRIREFPASAAVPA